MGKRGALVGLKADVWDIAGTWSKELILAVALVAFYAVWPASVINRAFKAYWSLEARFVRNLTPTSTVCAYQPILE